VCQYYHMIKIINESVINFNENYKPAELARTIGVSYRTVVNWMTQGKQVKLTKETKPVPVSLSVNGASFINGKEYLDWVKEVNER
jgi:hypothetical protein